MTFQVTDNQWQDEFLKKPAHETSEEYSRSSYRIADAMLKARGK